MRIVDEFEKWYAETERGYSSKPVEEWKLWKAAYDAGAAYMQEQAEKAVRDRRIIKGKDDPMHGKSERFMWHDISCDCSADAIKALPLSDYEAKP